MDCAHQLYYSDILLPGAFLNKIEAFGEVLNMNYKEFSLRVSERRRFRFCSELIGFLNFLFIIFKD